MLKKLTPQLPGRTVGQVILCLPFPLRNLRMAVFQDLLDKRAADSKTLEVDAKVIVDAQDQLQKATLAVADANKKQLDDQAVLANDEKSIADAIGANGPFFTPNADGSVTVYLLDTGGQGYHTVEVKAASTPIG